MSSNAKERTISEVTWSFLEIAVVGLLGLGLIWIVNVVPGV